MFADIAHDISRTDFRFFRGRVAGLNGLKLEATGPLEAMRIGARARLGAPDGPAAEIVGFAESRAILMPFETLEGLRPGAPVFFMPESGEIRVSPGWLGRVVDAFGAPADHRGPLPRGSRPRAIRANPPSAHGRARVGPRLDLGVKAVNLFAAICEGQRMGLFAGSGVGKSVLMSMLAKGAAADVVVIGLIGERGREVREFIEDSLGPEGLKRAVVVAATSDEPALRRRQAAYLTLAIAEHFRDEGLKVLCLLDSVTRFAMAQREIGLASGEPPTTKGYTPSVFAELPRLLERAGPGVQEKAGRASGSITGIFTVLVDGDDHNEPVADAARGILDGHLVLERRIAERGRYPAVNVLRSISRLMPQCHTAEEQALVATARRALAHYADMEELIRIGAYVRGADPDIDRAIALNGPLERFLAQAPGERQGFRDSFAELGTILASH